VNPDVSVVIPLRDELPNVVPLHDEWTGVLARLGRPYEFILVDDGSMDGTFDALTAVAAADPAVRAVRLSRNFGQTAAFSAGFDLARGRYIVTADGDLQNDPADLPRMLDVARECEIVCGWRRRRRDAFLTRQVPSIVANRLLALVSGVRLHDNGCSLKVYRAEVIKPLALEPGMHRYLPALASQRGGRVIEVVVHHRPRRFGASKYGLSRTFAVLRDLVRLRRLMRAAAGPPGPRTAIYEIAEMREVGRTHPARLPD
jgi:glycosyltransferase involved in cell wall biosynthesis